MTGPYSELERIGYLRGSIEIALEQLERGELSKAGQTLSRAIRQDNGDAEEAELDRAYQTQLRLLPVPQAVMP